MGLRVVVDAGALARALGDLRANVLAPGELADLIVPTVDITAFVRGEAGGLAPTTLPAVGDVGYFMTRLRQNIAAVAGAHATMRIAIAPTSTTRNLAKLTLVGFHVQELNGGDFFSTARFDGHLGAAPTAPNGTMKKLYRVGVPNGIIDSEHVARTDSVGTTGVGPEDDGAASDGGRFFYRWVTSSLDPNQGLVFPDTSGYPGPITREVDRAQPHLCGFIISATLRTVNVATNFQISAIVREEYR